MQTPSLKVAIVAGEKSGDYLGAQLMRSMREKYPNAEFVGICGPLMQATGGATLADIDKLTIFGLDGVFRALPELIRIRRRLIKHFINWRADVFIGIDAPDFNRGLERKLKDQGIAVVHYVSPTVWAWRPKRIKKIRRAIHLMLALFPFEEKFYREKNIPVSYVGHPLAKEIAGWRVNSELLRSLDLSDKRLVAILPGSRMSEVSKLAPIMLQGAKRLAAIDSNLKFAIPAANQRISNYLKNLEDYDPKIVQLFDGHSRDLLAVCHMAILASGTAALEAALFAKPMVVMYKVSRLSAWVYKNSIVVKHYSMPNHLTHPPAVKELIQEDATVDNLILEAQRLLDDQAYYSEMQRSLSQIGPNLTAESASLATQAICDLIDSFDDPKWHQSNQ